MKVILWADEPDHALPVRAKLREAGHTAMIRDARSFQASDAEACDAIAFIAAGQRDQIVAAYRSPHAVARLGEVRIYDVETGNFGQPLGVPDLGIAAEQKEKEPTERDLLSQRLDAMSDQDLRTYAKGVLGRPIPEDLTREDIEAALRQPEAGEGKVSPQGVEPVEPPAKDAGQADNQQAGEDQNTDQTGGAEETETGGDDDNAGGDKTEAQKGRGRGRGRGRN